MTNLRILSATDILDAQDLVVEELEVPEWGGTVLVKTLSGTERDALEASMAGQGSGKDQQERMRNFRARMVQAVLVDSDGRRIFTHNQIEQLGRKSSKALTRVFRKANELSGLTDADVATITADLGEDQSDSSGSDSPAS